MQPQMWPILSEPGICSIWRAAACTNAPLWVTSSHYSMDFFTNITFLVYLHLASWQLLSLEQKEASGHPCLSSLVSKWN